MNPESAADGSSADETGGPSVRIFHRLSTLSSCAALAIVFFGLGELDLPIVRYQRSVTTPGLDNHLSVPWMAMVSELGNWLGEGWHLFTLGVILIVAGWAMGKQPVTLVGVQALIGQGLSALSSNLLKHIVARPRPKFVHSAPDWHWMPSLEAGWDSFPSGHTTATFAMATVFAKRWPALTPLFVAVASFVGLSRVLRASHFPTDVLGGVVLGILCGSLAARPWKEWASSLEEGLRHAAVGVTGAFAVLWTLARPAEDGMAGVALIALGIVALLTGLWLRRRSWRAGHQAAPRQDRTSRALVAYGLACMTTAPLVVASVGCAALSYYLGSTAGQAVGSQASRRATTVMVEGAMAAGVLCGLVILCEARGILPLQ